MDRLNFDDITKWMAVGMCLFLIIAPLTSSIAHRNTKVGYYIAQYNAARSALHHDYVGIAMGIIGWHLALLTLAAASCPPTWIGIALFF